MMNTPITVPSVLAAFVSLENLASFLETPLVVAFFLLLSDSVEETLSISLLCSINIEWYCLNHLLNPWVRCKVAWFIILEHHQWIICILNWFRCFKLPHYCGKIHTPTHFSHMIFIKIEAYHHLTDEQGHTIPNHTHIKCS